MVLATEMILPPRRNSYNGPEPVSKSPPKSHWWFLTSKIKPSTSYGGSTYTVATQKLRESKWFEQDEERLFCAVIESGFIVEIMLKEQTNTEIKSHYGVVSVEPKKSELATLCRQTEIEPSRSHFVYRMSTEISRDSRTVCSRHEQNLSAANWQIIICKYSWRESENETSRAINYIHRSFGQMQRSSCSIRLKMLQILIISILVFTDKKPTANEIFVYTVNKHENRLKIVKLSIAELWSQNYKMRINNINDKNKKANIDKDIKSQINCAMKHKIIFHNSLHFVDFCRYGEQLEARKRQVSESVKWGTVGMNAGIFLLQREKSHSFSK
jgi:hypothetical protein